MVEPALDRHESITDVSNVSNDLDRAGNTRILLFDDDRPNPDRIPIESRPNRRRVARQASRGDVAAWNDTLNSSQTVRSKTRDESRLIRWPTQRRREKSATESHIMAERNEQIENLRWKKLPVLDDGFVCLVDVMGDDSSVVQAARVSYGAGTKKVSDDRTLIRYLMRHRHSTPFEMAEIKLLVRVPMDCWRQWIRHRTASVNEYSTRYSLAIDSTQTTAPDEWRTQAKGNRQGSDNVLPHAEGNRFSQLEVELQDASRAAYEARIEAGVAREQARKDLPLSTYTEAYWKIDLHNLLHFLSLRMEAHAQKEIRDYAHVIGHQIVKLLFPIVWEAFEDYRQHGMFLTRLDQEVIARLVTHAADAGQATPFDETQFLAAQDENWKPLTRCRERDECREKLKRLRILSDEAEI